MLYLYLENKIVKVFLDFHYNQHFNYNALFLKKNKQK